MSPCPAETQRRPPVMQHQRQRFRLGKNIVDECIQIAAVGLKTVSPLTFRMEFVRPTHSDKIWSHTARDTRDGWHHVTPKV